MGIASSTPLDANQLLGSMHIPVSRYTTSDWHITYQWTIDKEQVHPYLVDIFLYFNRSQPSDRPTPQKASIPIARVLSRLSSLPTWQILCSLAADALDMPSALREVQIAEGHGIPMLGSPKHARLYSCHNSMLQAQSATCYLHCVPSVVKISSRPSSPPRQA